MNTFDRTLRIIFSLVFAAAGLMFFATNFLVFGTAAKVSGDLNEMDNPRDPLRATKATILEHRNANGRGFKPGYIEMAKVNDIKANRFVHLSAFTTIRDLLNPGEAPPEASQQGVFAKSRAIIFARKECERLLETLARECVVEHADGRPDGDLVRISAAIRFVQRDNFGALDDAARYVFSTASTQIGDRSLSVSLAGSASRRAEIYKKAAAECAAVRRREGTCAITQLALTASRDRDGGYKVVGMASYAFLIRAGA